MLLSLHVKECLSVPNPAFDRNGTLAHRKARDSRMQSIYAFIVRLLQNNGAKKRVRHGKIPPMRQKSTFLASGPLRDDDAEIVELLDGCLDIAAGTLRVFRIGMSSLRDNDDAAIAPGTGRNGGNRPSQILGTNLRLLPASGGLAVGSDAQSQHVGTGGEEGIGPSRGVMHVGVEAFGGQRNPRKLNPLLVALTRRGLRLALGIDRGLRHTDDRLLFLAASHNAADNHQATAQQIPDASSFYHREKHNRNQQRKRAFVTASTERV